MVPHYYNSSFQTKTQNLLFNEKAYLGDKYIKKMNMETALIVPYNLVLTFFPGGPARDAILQPPSNPGMACARGEPSGYERQHVTVGHLQVKTASLDSGTPSWQ